MEWYEIKYNYYPGAFSSTSIKWYNGREYFVARHAESIRFEAWESIGKSKKTLINVMQDDLKDLNITRYSLVSVHWNDKLHRNNPI